MRLRVLDEELVLSGGIIWLRAFIKVREERYSSDSTRWLAIVTTLLSRGTSPSSRVAELSRRECESAAYRTEEAQ